MHLSHNQLGGNQKNTYLIHDNGGRPFKVTIKKKTVYVCKHIEEDLYDETNPLIFNALKIFIGNSPLLKMTRFSGGHGLNFNGNSILLKIKENYYVHIGGRIISFVSSCPIIKFLSPVGNSDVPYPFAIDIGKNIYLLIENVILMHNNKIMNELSEYDNPYDYYYDNIKISTDIGAIPRPPKAKVLFENIDNYYIGKSKFTLSYHPLAKDHYDWITRNRKNKSVMSIVDIDGNKKILTERDYISLMNRFSKFKSFKPLRAKKIYVDRL